ncbi:MAG TPA: hypothetical protein VF284_12295 [Rhodanobacteraceae bacterium]
MGMRVRGMLQANGSSRWDTVRNAALVALLIAFAVVAAGCHHTPAEQQVRQAIDAAATAARNGDTGGVLALVADDFTGNDGDFDRHSLRQFLAWRALRQDRTGVLVGPVTFARQGDRISATFNLVLTGGKPGDLLPNQSAIYAMTTAWRREHGKWVCYNATWRQRG